MVKVKEHPSLYCGYFKPICGNNNIQLPPKKINFFPPIIYSRVASKLGIKTSGRVPQDSSNRSVYFKAIYGNNKL